jgi:Family of unknown function (DUF5675)
MKITVTRNASCAGATIGVMHIDGAYACHTLEDEVREVEGEPVEAWKIHGQTAIPVGDYIVSLEDSARFGPDTLTINNVPGFKYIRMHAGNVAADTEGCLLLGMRATEASLVGGTSRPAVALVKGEVRAAIDRGEVVHIHISNLDAVA